MFDRMVYFANTFDKMDWEMLEQFLEDNPDCILTIRKGKMLLFINSEFIVVRKTIYEDFFKHLEISKYVTPQEQTQTFYKFKFRTKFVKEMFDVAIFAATEKLLEPSQETVQQPQVEPQPEPQPKEQKSKVRKKVVETKVEPQPEPQPKEQKSKVRKKVVETKQAEMETKKQEPEPTVEEKPKKVSKKKEAEVKAVSKVKDGSNEQQTTDKSKKNAFGELFNRKKVKQIA